MKPSSPAEVCSIKSKKHKHFQPFSLSLSEMIRTRTAKQHSRETQRARTSRQPRSGARPRFTLCIPRRRFNHRAARGQDDELVTCQHNQPRGDLSTQVCQRPGKSCPTNSSLLFNSRKTNFTRKPALNSVTRSVCLCYLGARCGHDKNKPCDKNIEWGRCGHGDGISVQ